MVDLRFILHRFMASATKSRAERLLRVDQAQTIARLSNVVCKSRRRASRNLDGCRIGGYYEPFYRLPDLTGLIGTLENNHGPSSVGSYRWQPISGVLN